MMKEGVEESYHLKANMLRQEAKIAEQLKSIEIERLKRLGKQIRAANQVKEFCAMCSLEFYGHLSTHRKSDGHLELKKFLHPKCDDCNAEFHNRAEYDDHLLSPQHMKTCKNPPSYKSEESRRNRLQILTEADEVQGLREEKPKKEKKEVKEGEAADGEKREENGQAMETEASEEDAKAEEEVDDKPEIEPILDFKDGDEIGPEIENKIPKYNCKRQVGFSLISQLVCFECRLCNKYFDTEATAEIHSRTFNHHRLFVKFLNEKANETKIAQKRAAAAAAEENERQKRIKLENETEATQEEAAKPSDELYDPTEATGDDDVKEEITDEAMNQVAETVLEKEEPAPIVEAPKVEEKKPEPVPEPAKEEPAVISTPTPAPTEKQPETPTKANEQPQSQQQQTPKSQNNTPNKNFNNNNRGGRGGRNNNNQRRSGRYGGRF